MHVSMFYGTPDDYVQVVCHQERYHDRMIAMGWRKTPEELKPAKKEDVKKPEGHELHIIGLADKDAVESYVKEHFGVDIDKRGSLETVKDKALAVINESGRSD